MTVRGLLLAGMCLMVSCLPSSNVTSKASCPQGPEYHYVYTDRARCATMPACTAGKPFRNACGCGCRVAAEEISGVTACGEDQRNVDACVEVYAPVCGWFATSPVECRDRYCSETFANSCFACKDPRVKVFTPGNCRSTRFR